MYNHLICSCICSTPFTVHLIKSFNLHILLYVRYVCKGYLIFIYLPFGLRIVISEICILCFVYIQCGMWWSLWLVLADVAVAWAVQISLLSLYSINSTSYSLYIHACNHSNIILWAHCLWIMFLHTSIMAILVFDSCKHNTNVIQSVFRTVT